MMKNTWGLKQMFKKHKSAKYMLRNSSGVFFLELSPQKGGLPLIYIYIQRERSCMKTHSNVQLHNFCIYAEFQHCKFTVLKFILKTTSTL